MAYFPFFMELSGWAGLIVGGGMVALRKARKLLPYGSRLTVAAPDIRTEFLELDGVALRGQAFEPALLDEVDFVVAATNDPCLNRRIFQLCRARKIPINSVDDPTSCTFLFPALVKSGNLTVGICSGGASPAAASYFKGQISALLPERLPEMLDWLQALRPEIKAALPDERDRAACFSQLFLACVERGEPLDRGELRPRFLPYAEESEEER